jgi:hypothetical protein
VHVDDAIEYMRRRWGKALRAEMLEAFSRDDSGPQYMVFGDYPDRNRGERYYMFEHIDMWVYRTFTGVPAGWKETRHIRSSVPIRRIELGNAPQQELLDNREASDGSQPSDGRTRIEKNGRRRN